MKKLLIVSATEFEIKPLVNSISFKAALKANLKQYSYKNLEIDILITGVGMVATAFEMGKTITHEYDFILNLGIAGSFPGKFEIGEVVHVTQDNFIELGAENDQEFISVFEMGFIKPDVPPFSNSFLVNNSLINNTVINTLKVAKGITVNKVHGNENSIKKLIDLFHPETESMEGAAFLYACLSEKIPCAQIRAISNIVEKRNREAWNIPFAIENLNKKAMEVLESL